MRRNNSPGSQVFAGLFIMLIGVIFLLDNFDFIDAHKIFHFWPVIFIALGIYLLTRPQRSPVAGLIFLSIGAVMLLDRMYIIHLRLGDLWPLIFVFIGLRMLIGYSGRRQYAVPGTPQGEWHSPGSGSSGASASTGTSSIPDADSIVSMTAFLSGNTRVCSTQDFRGGNASAVMGGCDLDLRGASIASSPAVLQVFAFWGGVKVRVPADWSVSMQGTPILGGFENKTPAPSLSNGKQLIITGEAIMGGVEVVN